MRGEPEAILITPPTGNGQTNEDGSADLGAAFVQAFTTTTSGALVLVASGWITLTADADCRLRFWRNNSLGVATQSDFPLWSKNYFNLWVDGWLNYRVIGVSGSGNLYGYASSR